MRVLRSLALMALIGPSLALADTYTCRASGTETCSGVLVTQNGTEVPIELTRGQRLHPGEGQEFTPLTSNWSKSSS